MRVVGVHGIAHTHLTAPEIEAEWLPSLQGGLEEAGFPRMAKEDLTIAIPAASALLQSLQLARSFRPLMRKQDSRHRQILDEEATIVQIVDEEIWSPVMQPAPERWLELAIVVEETNLLDVWQETIAEFQHLMERHGAFRRVRVWQLVNPSDGTVQLLRRKGSHVDRSQPRRAGELLDPTGRRLILFVSDCTSVGWLSGRVPTLLSAWISQNPLTVLQLLPERFWNRSSLGLGDPVWLSATLPGLRNDRLTVEGLPAFDPVLEPAVEPKHSATPSQNSRLILPIVTLEPAALLQWARVIAGIGDQMTAGVVLDLQELTAYRQIKQQAARTLNAEQLVRRFRGTASPTAQRLAERMAAVPVSWSVMRLIQRNFSPQAETVHVAEVFLSGLLHPVTPDGEASQETGTPRSQPRRYDFVQGVRQQLIYSVAVSKTEQVMEQVADDLLSRLPIEVRTRLSADIARRLGRSIRSFEAFLLPDLFTDLPIEATAQAELLPFAAITAEVLQQLGGEYAELATRLSQTPAPVVTTVVEFPALQEFEFEMGVIEETETEAQLLQPIECVVATVEVQRSGLLRQQFKVVIKQETKQVWGYVEPLSDTVELQMVSIPSGTFLMGSPENEPERTEYESPQHQVTIAACFMGKYPITQAQWQIVANFPQIDRPLDPDPSHFKAEDRPVEQVSWLDATEFCARLSQHTEKPYRLPTEAEWEYACRAGTTTPFHFGETITPELANYKWIVLYNKIKVTKEKDFRGTTPIGQFQFTNAFGLSDLHGNVWDWCEDHWHSNYEDAPIDGSAWINPEAKENASRVLRGGSWMGDPWYCRSAIRIYDVASLRNIYTGFRVVCSASRT